MSDMSEQRVGNEVSALRQIIQVYRIAQHQGPEEHLDRLTEMYTIASQALDGDSSAALFGHLLRQLLNEARSVDGVTAPTVRAALGVAEQVDRQLRAFQRIVAELHDDGITDDALIAAEQALDG